MKNRFMLLLLAILIGSILLSACGTGPTISSWPGITYEGEKLLVAYGSFVMSVQPSDGAIMWKYPAAAEGGRTFFAAPSLGGNLVVSGDYQGVLYGIDAATGLEKWKFNQATLHFVGGPLYVNDTFLAPSSDNTLYAIGVDGNLLWKFTTQHALWSKPVSDGQAVYVASMDHNVYALDLKTGKRLWSKDLGGALVYGPALDESGVLYIGTMGSEVVAIESNTGKILWRYKTAAGVWGTPAIHEGALFFGDVNGGIYAVNTETGSIINKSEIGASITSSPALFTDGVVFVSETGIVRAYSYDLKTKLWEKTITGKTNGSPIVAGDRIVVGITDSEKLLQTYDFKGNEGWSLNAPK